MVAVGGGGAGTTVFLRPRTGAVVVGGYRRGADFRVPEGRAERLARALVIHLHVTAEILLQRGEEESVDRTGGQICTHIARFPVLLSSHSADLHDGVHEHWRRRRQLHMTGGKVFDWLLQEEAARSVQIVTGYCRRLSS